MGVWKQGHAIHRTVPAYLVGTQGPHNMTENSESKGHMTALEAAMDTRRSGSPMVVPLDPDTGAPCLSWEEYEAVFMHDAYPTDDEVYAWWGVRWPQARIGLAFGSVILVGDYGLVHQGLAGLDALGEEREKAERVGEVWIRTTMERAEAALYESLERREPLAWQDTDSGG